MSREDGRFGGKSRRNLMVLTKKQEQQREYEQRPETKAARRLYHSISKHKVRDTAYEKQYRKLPRVIELKREYRRGVKNAAYQAYGGYECAWCGDSNILTLSIDHINNDGAKHRKEVKQSIYIWLKEHNYPPGFQILCMSCQFAKRNNNGVLPLNLKDRLRSIDIKVYSLAEYTKKELEVQA